MKRHPFQNRRTRLRLALLVVLSLLFQQFALAAYACPELRVPTVNAPMSAHCGDVSASQQRGDALCGQTSAEQPLTTQDARLPNIPPSSIPALLPAPPLTVATQVSHTPQWSETTSPGTDIAPTLRFRVLLI